MKTIILTGVLNSGVSHIGGETTGWVLITDTQGDTEVDVSQIVAAAKVLNGQLVTMTGHFVTKDYIERGSVEILIAENIRVA